MGISRHDEMSRRKTALANLWHWSIRIKSESRCLNKMQVLGSDSKCSNDWLNWEAQGQYRWATHKGIVSTNRWNQRWKIRMLRPISPCKSHEPLAYFAGANQLEYSDTIVWGGAEPWEESCPTSVNHRMLQFLKACLLNHRLGGGYLNNSWIHGLTRNPYWGTQMSITPLSERSEAGS